MISQRDEDRFDEGTVYVFSSLLLNWQMIHPQQSINLYLVQIKSWKISKTLLVPDGNEFEYC